MTTSTLTFSSVSPSPTPITKKIIFLRKNRTFWNWNSKGSWKLLTPSSKHSIKHTKNKPIYIQFQIHHLKQLLDLNKSISVLYQQNQLRPQNLKSLGSTPSILYFFWFYFIESHFIIALITINQKGYSSKIKKLTFLLEIKRPQNSEEKSNGKPLLPYLL